jgi:hypothetical protein
MSNDLLFPILPRNSKVPVEVDDRVQKISKDKRTKQLSDEEKEQHHEERIVSEKEQYHRHHQNHPQQEQQPQAHDEAKEQPQSSNHEPSDVTAHAEQDEDELVYDEHGEAVGRHDGDNDDTQHVDFLI